MSREVVDVTGCLQRSALEICGGDLREKTTCEAAPRSPAPLRDGRSRGCSRCFRNLLKNAVKFTPLRVLIWVRTFNQRARDEIRDHGERLVVGELADNGIRIDSHHLSRAFSTPLNKWTGAAVSARLGLGLKHCKGGGGTAPRHVDRFQRGQGKGYTFTVVWRRWPPHASQPAAPGCVARVGGHTVKVLLVEDHPDTLHSRGCLKNGATSSPPRVPCGGAGNAEKEVMCS